MRIECVNSSTPNNFSSEVNRLIDSSWKHQYDTFRVTISQPTGYIFFTMLLVKDAEKQ